MEAPMKRFAGISLGCAVIALGLLVAPLAYGQGEQTQPPADEGKQNVLLTFRLGKIEGEKRIPMKSYDLVVASGRMGSKLLSGERVPFPTTSGEGESAQQSYVYQNVGFVTSVEARILDEKKIRLRADIEDSSVREGAEGVPPAVETRQLNINVILTDGVPLELTRVEGLTDQSGYVEVEAKILK
jgi:hypothetical protein